MELLKLIGRNNLLFSNDINNNSQFLDQEVSSSKFLVLGGAGTIGQAVVKELFKRNPKKLHVVDIAENNLVELVRDLRSSIGYIDGEFETFTLDIGSEEYDAFISQDGEYDYVLNLSALKHVRSEKDNFTLMRMIKVNILNTQKTIEQSIDKGVKKYFCVSTDKAANPVNMMGASKRIMEMFLMKYSEKISISTARFANVAFSDGSLLYGFKQRIEKRQPIVAPDDVKRYFIIPQEAGELCLMSCIFGENRDIYFPKLSKELHLISFKEIAINFLKKNGLIPYLCNSEDEARNFNFKANPKKWPCLFVESDTTGEKSFEEFYTKDEKLDLNSFENLGIIKNNFNPNLNKLDYFNSKIKSLLRGKIWSKIEIVELFRDMIPNFNYVDKKKYLESKM